MENQENQENQVNEIKKKEEDHQVLLGYQNILIM